MDATLKTGIEAAQAKLAQMKAEGIGIQRLNPTEKALADPKSRHKAIRAMCYECLGGSIDGIRNCPTWFGVRSPGRKYVGCPLRIHALSP